MVSPMSAAVDSRTCIRRTLINSLEFSMSQESYCDPMGGINIYGHTLNVTENGPKKNSIVILASRFDTFSMFDALAPGADSAMSALIVIITAAELLNRPGIREQMYKSDNKRSLLLALFDGESFDYIGSSHAAYQMANNQFLVPLSIDNQTELNLEHLSHFIELDQVAHHGGANDPLKVYLHKHLNADIDELVKLFKDEKSDLNNIEVNYISDPNMPLPPSSVQSFLKLVCLIFFVINLIN